jgi:transposase
MSNETLLPTQPQIPTQVPTANTWIGIDVAKDKLDVHLLLQNDQCFSGVFENAASGFKKLLKWCRRYADGMVRHFCLEATGTYSLAPAVALVEAGERVSIVNPYRAKCYAQGDGTDNKNDRTDARSLARMCREKQLALWQAPPAIIRELVSLSRYLGDLVAMKSQQTNRLGEPEVTQTVHASLTKVIEQLDEQIDTIEKAILDLINSHPDLRAKKDLLVSIPGIGERTAARILAEVPNIEAFSDAPALVRYAGLNPVEHESGTSVHRASKIARKGNRHLRASLYMPALSAIQHNPAVGSFYKRLCAAGKKKKVALVAAMRKLLSIVFGVLHHGKPFSILSCRLIPASC